MVSMSLGERLKQLRRGTSQAAFGALLGVSQPTIRNYENNERLPDSGFIKTVCDKLNVTADWLIFGTEQKEKTSNVGGFPEEEKIQHIDIAESHRKKNLQRWRF